MRGLRLLGLIGFLVFVAAAFTPLANSLNLRMAGVARLEPSDAIVVLGRGGADSDGILTNRSLRRGLPGGGLCAGGLPSLPARSRSADGTRARARLSRGLGGPAAGRPTAPPRRPHPA